MNFSTAPDAAFFASSYFLTNFGLVLSYPLLRIFTEVGRRDIRQKDAFGFSYENSIIYTGLAFALIHFLRSSSLREFILNCLVIAKIVVVSLLFFAKFRISIFFMLICVVLWVVVPYPRYNAKSKMIKIQSEEEFDHFLDQNLRQNPSSSKKKEEDGEIQNYQYRDKHMLFVEFYSDWMFPCLLAKELWYSYSNKYTTPKLKFLQIKVDRLPQIAKRFNINTSGFSKQLPTVVILQNGEETVRFPPIKSDSKVDKVVKLDYKILLNFFDLESRYLQTRLIKAPR